MNTSGIISIMTEYQESKGVYIRQACMVNRFQEQRNMTQLHLIISCSPLSFSATTISEILRNHNEIGNKEHHDAIMNVLLTFDFLAGDAAVPSCFVDTTCCNN